jgi:hypothetical protein
MQIQKINKRHHKKGTISLSVEPERYPITEEPRKPADQQRTSE